MKYNIPHSKPTIDSSDVRAVAKVVKTGQLAQGKIVDHFEKKLAVYQNSKGAVATNSGTSALHLALLALNIKRGDEVIIPSYVCTALMNSVHYTGAKVKIVDVEYDDFNISVSDVKKVLSKKTKAIIVPHMFGLPANLKSLLRLGVPIIEDCAQSIGAKFQKRRVGTFGTLSIFSFYATKMLTTGEGGVIVTNNQKYLKTIHDLRDYDQKKDYKVRYNYKMTDTQASLGLNQLLRLSAFIKDRREIAKRYQVAFSACSFETPCESLSKQHIYFRYVIKLKKSKEKFIATLKHRGIHCASPIYKPLHQYVNQRKCPVTEQLMREAVSIPLYPSLTNSDVCHIISVINHFVI